MPVGIEVWLTQVPPITRAWLACAVLTSLAVVCFVSISVSAKSDSTHSNVSWSLRCSYTLATRALLIMLKYAAPVYFVL